MTKSDSTSLFECINDYMLNIFKIYLILHLINIQLHKNHSCTASRETFFKGTTLIY